MGRLVLKEEVDADPKRLLGGEMKQKELNAAGVDWLVRGVLRMPPKNRHRGSDRAGHPWQRSRRRSGRDPSYPSAIGSAEG